MIVHVIVMVIVHCFNSLLLLIACRKFNLLITIDRLQSVVIYIIIAANFNGTYTCIGGTWFFNSSIF